MRYKALFICLLLSATACDHIGSTPPPPQGDATFWMVADTPQVGSIVEVTYAGSDVIGGHVRLAALLSPMKLDPNAPNYSHLESKLEGKFALEATAKFVSTSNPQLNANFSSAKSVSISADNLKVLQPTTNEQLVSAVRQADGSSGKDAGLSNMLSQLNGWIRRPSVPRIG